LNWLPISKVSYKKSLRIYNQSVFQTKKKICKSKDFEMKCFWKRKIMKKRKKFLMPMIKLQPWGLKFEERLQVSFLLLASKFQKPNVEGWEQIVYFLLPSINFKAQSKELHEWPKKRVDVAFNLWQQKLKLGRKKNLWIF
jgi:hypothetical protein